jgi:subtilisin family serine protease
MGEPANHLSGIAWLCGQAAGHSLVGIGLIDGPVALGLYALPYKRITVLDTSSSRLCSPHAGSACSHGTFMAGMLMGGRDSPSPGLCPECQLFSRPIFIDSVGGATPSATAEDVAAAIVDCVGAGARIVNISASVRRCDRHEAQLLAAACSLAARNGVIVVTAAGNDATTAGSALTRLPTVLPVTACTPDGMPLSNSNYGRSIGQRGVCAPGVDVVGFAPDGTLRTASGTSVAAVIVTGVIALLWSLFPDASAADVIGAVLGSSPRRSAVPPPLNPVNAYTSLQRRSARVG